MQPLVLKIVNKIGFGDYTDGLEPDHFLKEDLGNLGVLGNPNEPLLNTAITTIVGGGRKTPKQPEKTFTTFEDTQTINRLKTEMYLDNVPEGILSSLK